MVLSVQDPSADRLTLVYSSFTCVYIPAIISYLLYSGRLLQLGNFACLPVIFAIVGCELFKWHLVRPSIDPKTGRARNMKKLGAELRLRDIARAVTSLLLFTGACCVAAVLFGAPALASHEQTLMFGLLMTALTAVPACLAAGSDLVLQLVTGGDGSSLGGMGGPPNPTVDLVVLAFRMSVIGAWLGGAFIPLDWDKPWQAWPITCSVGCLVGCCLAHFTTMVQLVPGFTRKRLLKRYN